MTLLSKNGRDENISMYYVHTVYNSFHLILNVLVASIECKLKWQPRVVEAKNI